MRFKAEIVNLSEFSRVVASLQPLGKLAVLKFKPDVTHVICTGDNESLQVWSQLNNAHIYQMDGYKCESNSNNEICLEVHLESLSKALKSVGTAFVVTMKLLKKFGSENNGMSGPGARPVLNLSSEATTKGGRRMGINQDVWVRVLRPSEIAAMDEPMCPPPEVTIIMPELKMLQTVCNRLQKISSTLTVAANWNGEFRMRAEGDSANVTTEFRNLAYPEDDESGPQRPQNARDRARFIEVSIDGKHLSKFLNSHTVAASAVACLCPGTCLIFYVFIDSTTPQNGGLLTFYVPARNSGN